MAAPTFPQPRIAPFLGALAAIVVLLALAATVTAQVADPAVSVAFDDPAANGSVGAANTTTLLATVTNDNAQLAGTVTLAVSAPDGWTIVADPATAFVLAPGASAPVTLTITAPEASTGALDGDVELQATITENAAAARTATASATFGVTRVDPVIPPPPPAPWYTTAPAIAAFILVPLLIVAAVGLIVYRRRQTRLAAEAAARAAAEAAAAHAAYLAREKGITITFLDGPKKYGPKREITFRAVVENVSGRSRVAVANVLQWPDEWSAAVSIPRMTLAPREKMTLTIYVNPSDRVPAESSATFIITAKPEEALELDERIVIDCVAPQVRIPLNGSGVTNGLAPRVNANHPDKRGVVRP